MSLKNAKTDQYWTLLERELSSLQKPRKQPEQEEHEEEKKEEQEIVELEAQYKEQIEMIHKNNILSSDDDISKLVDAEIDA